MRRKLLVVAVLVGASLLGGTRLGAQGAGRLDFSSADETDVIMGAADRLVVPEAGTWRLMTAPTGIEYSPRAFCRAGDTVYAGTRGSGLMVRRGASEVRYVRRPDGIAGDVVTHVVEHGGRLFVATDGGVSIWDGRVFVTWTPANSALPGAFVIDLEPDGSGGVYAALRGGGGAHVRSDRTVVPWPAVGGPGGPVTSMARYFAGGLAVAGPGGVFFLPDGGAWSSVPLPFTPVDLLETPGTGADHPGARGLLAGGEGGLWFVQGPGLQPRKVADEAGIRSLGRVEGQIWASFDGGIRVLGPEDRFVPLDLPPASASPELRGVVTVGSETLGAGPSGLFRRAGSSWARIWPPDGAPPSGADAVAGDGRGRLVVASQGRLLTRDPAGVWVQVVGVTVPPGLSSMALSGDGSSLVLVHAGGRVTELSLPAGTFR